MTNDNRQLQHNSDAFRNVYTTRTNVLDIASHYPYNPERLRLFVDGSRVFPEYNSVSQYNHAGDVHEISPAAGETVAFRTAERPRYVVQYELATTFACNLNKAGGDLQGDDRFRAGLWDGTDGWYLEHNATHEADKADFVEVDDGTETYREEDIDVLVPFTRFARFKLQTGWYKVTRQKWERSYSSNGHQINDVILNASSDDNNGPTTGNLPVRYEIRADSNTSDLRLDAGSVAQVNLGRTTSLTRNKVDEETVNVDDTNTWIPLFAVRTDPNRNIVNTQFTDLAISEFGGNADIRVSVNSFAAQNVADVNGNQLTDSDFSTPPLFNDTNNVLEVSEAVDQVVDSTGTLQSAMANPGGFQIGFDALNTGGGNTVTDNAPGPVASKRPLYPQDIAVVLANAGGTGDVTFQFRTEQDW
jgi:hypothetical protein